MYYCEDLNKSNIKNFKKLNNKRKEFNNLNKNFFTNYHISTYAKRAIQRNKVKLLKKNDDYIAYIWAIPKSKFIYDINSFYPSNKQDIDGYNILFDLYKNNSYLYYLCEKNDFNYDLLKDLGFSIKYGTIIMNADVSNAKIPICDNKVSFEILKIGKQEKLRCEIQNKVFDSPNRVPLTIRDVYFDERQEYYLNKAAIFIKYNQKYIGYGQIILDNDIPTIVNLGIIENYRNKGLGKYLLKYLMYMAHMYNFKNVYIKVSSDNFNAINLYLNCGFKILKEYHQWYLIT